MGMSALLGLMVGSFLNVVIHRLPRMLDREWREQCAWLEDRQLPAIEPYNLAHPRSACPHCGHAIKWYENIPLLSWSFLRGRCAGCGARISTRYPLVEALTGLLFGFAAWHFGFGLQAFAAWLLLAFLLALCFIDLDTHLLPDNLTLPLIWVGLLVNLMGGFVPLDEAVSGAILGYLALWSVYHVFRLLTGKEGMGFGDFKLLSALGAWMGWKMLLPIVLAASMSGAVVGIALISLSGHDKAKPIPFGPWLALGGVVSLFWGKDMLTLWLG